jgi:predicted amidohydrolase
MARPVTVSCVTAPPLPLDRSTSIDRAIQLETAHWRERIETVLPHSPDLIVLPEAADRPQSEIFGPERILDYVEARGPAVRDSLARLARENRCNIAYSGQWIDGDVRVNRTQYINRAGETTGYYDKNHLVIAEHDESALDYGTDTGIVDLDFGRVGTAICFDLNFDELRRRYQQGGVELMVFSSEYHGGLMQNYWAYSLRAYFAGSIRPPAPSAILSPQGEILAETTNYFSEVTARINLDYVLVHLDGHWSKLAAMKAKYRDGIQIHDPGRLGSVLITAVDPTVTTASLCAEFELEQLDDYLDRARTHRAATINSKG